MRTMKKTKMEFTCIHVCVCVCAWHKKFNGKAWKRIKFYELHQIQCKSVYGINKPFSIQLFFFSARRISSTTTTTYAHTTTINCNVIHVEWTRATLFRYEQQNRATFFYHVKMVSVGQFYQAHHIFGVKKSVLTKQRRNEKCPRWKCVDETEWKYLQ